jgi:steroid delta-isomerase-like uncharacterized protein
MADIDVVRRFYEDFCNKRQLDLADELMTAGHQYHDPNVPAGVGPAAMAEVIGTYQRGVDGNWDVRDLMASGDRVVARWIGRGTHIGDINGIPPTGRKVEVDAISIHRMEDGKIAENWTVWDTLGFLRQLGVIPEAAAAAV